MNLDFTVAVTQNFTTTSNFVESWISCQKGRPKLSNRWYERLKEARPDLAEAADKHRLPYDPVEKRREKRKRKHMEREAVKEAERREKEAKVEA